MVASDGRWIATGTAPRFGVEITVRIWDAATGRGRTAFAFPSDSRWCSMAISPDDRWLAVGGRDGTIRIWDVVAERVVAMMRVEGSVEACAWIGDGQVSVGGAGGLYLFDFTPARRATAAG